MSLWLFQCDFWCSLEQYRTVWQPEQSREALAPHMMQDLVSISYEYFGIKKFNRWNKITRKKKRTVGVGNNVNKAYLTLPDRGFLSRFNYLKKFYTTITLPIKSAVFNTIYDDNISSLSISDSFWNQFLIKDRAAATASHARSALFELTKHLRT